MTANGSAFHYLNKCEQLLAKMMLSHRTRTMHIPKTLIKTFIQQNAQQTRRIETHHQATFFGCSMVLYPLATSEHRSRAYDNFEKALSN